MATEVSFTPRDKMLKGFNTACDVIVGTIGPKGGNVYIDDAMAPRIVNDGGTISLHIELNDKLENLGNKVVKNTCGQQNDDVGDGRTTTTAILQSLVNEGIKRPENPMDIRKSLFKASKKVVKELSKISHKIEKKDIGKVALIASEDKQIARMVSEIINKVGTEASIVVEDSRTFNTTYEIVDGYEANVGFISNDFVTEKGTAKCILEDAHVIVSDKKLSSLIDMMPLFQKLSEQKISKIIFVMDDIESSMLGVLAQNSKAGTYNICVIKATGDLLKDIEATTGARRVSDETGVTFQNIEVENLGFVKKFVADANKSRFVPKTTKGALVYANTLQKFANEEQNMYVKERLQKRISQLRGGIAFLKIGGHTDYDREYRKPKAEDAIKSCKAALEEGVVEGGGITLYRISELLKGKDVGEILLQKALRAPLRKIIENAGKDYTSVIKDMPQGQGYDAQNHKYVDMFKKGIIGASKVDRCAIENSVSNAASFLTSFATITEYVPDTK